MDHPAQFSTGKAGPCNIPASTFQLFLNPHFGEKETNVITQIKTPVKLVI